MKHIAHNIFISLTAALGACAFFAWYHGYILVMVPGMHTLNTQPAAQQYHKKEITVWYYAHGAHASEKINVVWPDDIADQAAVLVGTWLTLINEHELLSKNVSLESVACTQAYTELILSLDRNLFEKQMSTYTKLMLIESLFMTLRDQHMCVQAVRMLVHHKPMQDAHLDFSNPWPLCGYIQQ